MLRQVQPRDIFFLSTSFFLSRYGDFCFFIKWPSGFLLVMLFILWRSFSFFFHGKTQIQYQFSWPNFHPGFFQYITTPVLKLASTILVSSLKKKHCKKTCQGAKIRVRPATRFAFLDENHPIHFMV